MDHVKTADGHFAFCLTADGKHALYQRKIFSACFYVMGLAVRCVVLVSL